MKATVTAGALASATSWISRALPSRPPVPILGGIVVDATERDVELAAFDYDICARGWLGNGVVSVDEPERVVVPGRLLAAVSKAFGSGQETVTLAVEDGVMVVTAGPRSRWSLPLMAADDYPNMPDLAPVVGEIEPDALAAAIDRVIPAAGRDDALPMLTGLAVNDERGPLTLVATDRHRMAVCETAWSPGDTSIGEVLAPAALMKLAGGAVAGSTGQVQVRSGDGILGFSTAQRSMSGRLLAGEFPRWRALDMLPDAPAFKARSSATLPTAAVRQAASRAAVMMDRAGLLTLTFAAGELGVAASGDGIGDADHRVPVIDHDGDHIAVQVRDEYLRDALAACGDQAARIDAGHGRLLVRPCTNDGELADGYRHTVMTVRFAGGAAVKDL